MTPPVDIGLIERLRDEAALCRNETATDVAELLEEAVDALTAAEKQRDEAIRLLAEWVAQVDGNGTSWDDWDESYKDAAYRPCGIRALLDAAITEAKKLYERR